MTQPPLILASASASRRAMLAAAGVAVAAIPTAIDEEAITAALLADRPADTAPGPLVAATLARAKAEAVARAHPHAAVIGSDSVVALRGRLLDKPASRAEAAAQLAEMSGAALELASAVALVRDGQAVFQTTATARLAVRPLSPAFIAAYLAAEWPAIGATVGAFRLEGMGVQLFSAIDGDHFTILGMPLLPLLGALRDEGLLAA